MFGTLESIEKHFGKNGLKFYEDDRLFLKQKIHSLMKFASEKQMNLKVNIGCLSSLPLYLNNETLLIIVHFW